MLFKAENFVNKLISIHININKLESIQLFLSVGTFINLILIIIDQCD